MARLQKNPAIALTQLSGQPLRPVLDLDTSITTNVTQAGPSSSREDLALPPPAYDGGRADSPGDVFLPSYESSSPQFNFNPDGKELPSVPAPTPAPAPAPAHSRPADGAAAEAQRRGPSQQDPAMPGEQLALKLATRAFLLALLSISLFAAICGLIIRARADT
ncbi:hypothetical protein LTR53_001284 [Teratosphaeriaceae sp. CCFEE 6253]|nr:hypothetical protein LTR53_001284 [Teratosphaeriaceae sp. CCFEE 6253]